MKIVPVSIVIPYRFHPDLEIWMQVRESDDELSGLFEFPGGKVDIGEIPIDTAVREVLEEVGLGLQKEKLKLSTIYTNNLSDKIISLYVFLYHDKGEFLTSWFKESDRDMYIEKIPPANKVFWDQVIKSIKTDAYE